MQIVLIQLNAISSKVERIREKIPNEVINVKVVNVALENKNTRGGASII